jgi:hypothetical protein
MNFPLVKLSKIKSHAVILALVIEDTERNDTYIRKYYSVIYEDNSECTFLTTNEPDSQFESRYLDEDFILVLNYDDLISDFEKTEIIGLAIDAGFNSIPKYVYYDIVFIEDELKQIFLEHLSDQISGYIDTDFTKLERVQLKKWFVFLE